MKMKRWLPILLILALAIGAGVYIYQKNVNSEEKHMARALAYLEKQKAATYETGPLPMEEDPQTGRVIRLQMDGVPYLIDKVITWLPKAAQIQRVKEIPELAYPHIRVGDKMQGNNEKLYYSEGRKIIEFTLGETDSLGFLLSLCGEMPTYPQVKEAFSEGIIRQLKDEIVWGEEDGLRFDENGRLDAIDIKTRETAEMLFRCIRNCRDMTDVTDVNLEPMWLPIEINGQGTGTFDMFCTTYQETGQIIWISFAPEDSEAFHDYVMGLQ